MNPKDLPAFRALMKDGYYRVMDRCIGLDCCGGVCASFDALAAATPEQLLGIIGEGRGVTPSRAEVTDAIAKLKYELGCDPVDYGGVGEAFRVLEESLDAGRKDRERVDWLEHQSEYGRVALDTNNPEFDNSEPKYTVYASAKGGRKFGDTLRAAIDQARGA